MRLDEQFTKALRKGWGTPVGAGPKISGLVRAAAQRNPTCGAALSKAAFTLMELLVVISIIGVLAAMVLGLAGVSTRKLRESRVKAELNTLVNAIENYKSRVGAYPPDNTNNPALPPLYYELAGCIFTNNPTPSFITVGSWETVPAATYRRVFSVSGVQNSARDPRDVKFTSFAPKASQYGEIDPSAVAGLTASDDVEILVVPFPGPPERMIQGKRQGDKRGVIPLNPWRYDASSTNRHNPDGFDLWAEILIAGRTNIIGNWKE